MSAFRFIQPCSPVTAKSVPAGDGWVHEPKLDGYRLQVAKQGRMMRLLQPPQTRLGQAPDGPGGG